MLNSNCGIYLIVSPTKGRYVGSSKSLKKRLNRYKNYSCSKQAAILASLKKHTFESHKIKILMYCEKEELLFWERVFGDLYLASAEFPNGLNITLPGYEDVPQLRTKEFRQRVSEIQKKRFEDPKERKKISQTTKLALSKIKDKISIAQKKRYENPEERIKRSEAKIRYYKNNPEAKREMSIRSKKIHSNPILAKKCKDALDKYYKENPDKRGKAIKEWRLKNPNYAKSHGEKLKKLYQDNPELRKKVSERTKLQLADPANNVRSKKVINTETGEAFSCIRVLAEHLGHQPNTISKWIKNSKIPYRYA